MFANRPARSVTGDRRLPTGPAACRLTTSPETLISNTNTIPPFIYTHITYYRRFHSAFPRIGCELRALMSNSTFFKNSNLIELSQFSFNIKMLCRDLIRQESQNSILIVRSTMTTSLDSRKTISDLKF